MTTQLRLTQEYIPLRDLVQQRVGLFFDDEQLLSFGQHVSVAMLRAGLVELQRYYRQLYIASTNSPLWNGLIQCLTENDTGFFNDTNQFRLLAHSILPDLIASRRAANHRVLRLWSAGCATGEEPYSLAILLREVLPDIDEWHITILGTDVNLQSLAHAAVGVYRAEALDRQMPTELLATYFDPLENGFRLSYMVRDMVRLDYINLVSDAYPSAIDFTENVDLIICRNVLSSFTTETAHHVVSRLYTALAPGGWLLIGQAEAFPNPHPGLIPPDASVAGVYRKSGHTWADDVPQLPNQAAQPTPPIWAELEDLPEAAFLPEIPEAAECYRRGQQMAEQMQWKAAHEWLECAISQNPLLLEAHYADALVYLQEGNDSAAIRALHHTLYIDPDFILAYFSLGLVYWRQRRFQKAAAIWQVTEELLAEHPSNEPLRCGDGMLPSHLRSMLTTYLEKVS